MKTVRMLLAAMVLALGVLAPTLAAAPCDDHHDETECESACACVCHAALVRVARSEDVVALMAIPACTRPAVLLLPGRTLPSDVFRPPIH